MNEIDRKPIQIQEQVVDFGTFAAFKVLNSNKHIVDKIFIVSGLHGFQKTLQNQVNSFSLFKFNFVH